MLRRSVVGVLLATVFLVAHAAATPETIQVLVLPFEIHAAQDLSYLKEEISQFIQSRLETEGAAMVELDPARRSAFPGSASDEATMRQMGRDTGADVVIWGSLTRIDNRISLDTRMLRTEGQQPVVSIYEIGSGMEILRSLTDKTAENLARQLFGREVIAQVRITGNRRIEADAIERVIRVRPGDVLRPGDISRDIKNIYQMGYFEDIRVESEAVPEGREVVFHVVEKPTIRRISFSGNKVFKDNKLQENLSISTGSILNIFTIRSNIEQLEAMYKDKNYHNIKIDYTVKELDNNQGDIEFVIEEGQKIRIRSIDFQGNQTFTPKALKKVIGTSEKGFFSWLTSSGELNRANLSQDAARLTAFYHTQGFIHAIVAEPEIDFEDHWIYITFKIQEGDRYQVGSVDLDGDLILPKAELMSRVQISRETYFNRERVREDIIGLTDLYADAGFAFAEVLPLTKEDHQNRLVDITYYIQKRNRVYFERIEIAGNTRTRDKVIRRELHIHERERYSGSRLKRSVRNLHYLDFFEDVKVDTRQGSTDDQMNVKIEVVEKPTGTFTLGAGYSTVDDVFVTGSVAQRNLFGRGQILKLSGQVGGVADQYNLSFTEPWLFDIPLSATANVYRFRREFDTYEQSSTGAGLAFSYPIFDFTRLSLAYRYDITDLSEITLGASDNIKALEGENATSAITSAITYDSRDRAFNTTQGQNHRLAYTYAGLGGDVGFHKVVGELGWYIPVYKGLISFIRGRSGYVRPIEGYILPDYEKFYLGGINTIRGFDFQDINIKTVNELGIITEEGGESFVQLNFELTYPLFEDIGIVGLVFYDTGNVYGPNASIDLGDLRHAAGYGIRWYSPIGPMRIEGGHILDPREENGEDSGVNWAFSIGGAF